MIKPILLLGNSRCTHLMASNLLSCGQSVCMVTRDTVSDFEMTADAQRDTFELLKETYVARCQGQVGNFKVSLTRNRETVSRDIGTIIISEGVNRISNISDYGLTPDSMVMPLSAFAKEIAGHTDFPTHGKVAILTDLYKASHPLILKDVLEIANRLRMEFESQTYIFTKHLKVAGNGLEALSREAKTLGTVFYKFSDKIPRITPVSDGRIQIAFLDQITGHELTLEPDAVIVDESLEPAPYLRDLSRIFRVDLDATGFLQTDNVHRTSVLTNRRGILVVGHSRSVQTDSDQVADAKAAVVTSLALARGSASKDRNTAEINTGRCIRCLTCFRICPYHAVTKADRLQIAPEACEGCGICTAECPREAIQLAGVLPLNLSEHLKNHQREIKTSDPLIVAFCCNRSAITAGETAGTDGHNPPKNLLIVPVPCAGSVSLCHLLAAFQHHADGVMILTCHDGNCHSENGTRLASHRAHRLSAMLSTIGIDAQRLISHSLAANMASEFSQKATQFEETIRRSYG